MQKSEYQIAIHNTYQNDTRNIVVGAVAGSGKTTTLLMLLEQIRGTAYFMAFNKSIVNELKNRIPLSNNIKIATCHSIGMKSLMSYFSKSFELDTWKTWKVLQKQNKRWKLPKKSFNKTALMISQLYDMYRMTLCESIEDLIVVADRQGLYHDSSILSKFSETLMMMETMNKNPVSIDFVDMIYLPATIKELQLPQPDNLFIDEAQDLNAAQHKMVDKMRTKGRFIAVGDPRQSIYGFAGADTNSFQRFIDKENTIQLPLSVCYRCGTDIVKYAQRYNETIQPFEGKDKGIVKFGTIDEVTYNDMVICRNLRPLIDTFFQIIDLGLPAFIKGKDIAKGLIDILKNVEVLSLGELSQYFKEELLKLSEKLIEKGIDSPLTHPSYVNRSEKYSVILRISFKFTTISEVISFVEEIFSDVNRENSVILSTIHKAKGLESTNVFFVDRQLIPSKFASTTEQIRQEYNLYYVGITRAKERLIFINSNGSRAKHEKFSGDQEKRRQRGRFI